MLLLLCFVALTAGQCVLRTSNFSSANFSLPPRSQCALAETISLTGPFFLDGADSTITCSTYYFNIQAGDAFFANISFVNCLARAILGRGLVSLQHTKFVNCSSNPTCEISVSLRGSTYCGGGAVSTQRLAIYDSEFIHCQSKNFNLLACIPAGLRWVATPPLTNESCWRIAFQSGRAKSGKLSCDSKS